MIRIRFRLSLDIGSPPQPTQAESEPYREVDMGALVERQEHPRLIGFQREDAWTLRPDEDRATQ